MNVKIKCRGSSEAKLSDLKIIQGNLKDLSEVNYEKLKGEILDLGFSAPFFCWTMTKGRKRKTFDLLDGTQRLRALIKMQEEGIELPPKFPIIDVDADSYKQAKKKILAISSQYGTITQEGLIEFNKDLGLSFNDIQDSFSFDGLDFDNMDILGTAPAKEEDAPNLGGDEKQYRIEIQFPNDMEMMDIHDDLTSRGYMVKIL